MSPIVQSHMLAALYQEIEERFTAFDDPAHGWEHVSRVYELAQRIAGEEEADQLITGSAALLHDIGRLIHRKGTQHALLSVEEARVILPRYPLEPEQVEAILHAIEVSCAGRLPAQSSASHRRKVITLKIPLGSSTS